MRHKRILSLVVVALLFAAIVVPLSVMAFTQNGSRPHGFDHSCVHEWIASLPPDFEIRHLHYGQEQEFYAEFGINPANVIRLSEFEMSTPCSEDCEDYFVLDGMTFKIVR
jgi:hypothetical protein